MHSSKLKAEALRLRVEERKSFPEILSKIKVSKSTLSLWLQGYELSSAELQDRRKINGQRSATKLWAKRPAGDRESHLSRVAAVNNLNSNQVGKLVEAVVLLRLTLHGFQVFGGVFDCERADWVVGFGDGPFLKIQVKTAKRGVHGAAVVCLTRSHDRGSKRYKERDFDFLVGYDLFSDKAYVWSWAETAHLGSSISVCTDAVERWDKLRR